VRLTTDLSDIIQNKDSLAYKAVFSVIIGLVKRAVLLLNRLIKCMYSIIYEGKKFYITVTVFYLNINVVYYVDHIQQILTCYVLDVLKVKNACELLPLGNVAPLIQHPFKFSQRTFIHL
jgi:hypothetical protein